MAETPRRHHRGGLDGILVELALAEVARTGSAEFTLRGLAREAGVSHVAAYRHFADKAALLARIAELGFADLTAAMRERAAGHPDPADAFVHKGLTYVRFAQDQPGHFRVMWHRDLADRSAHPALQAVSQAAYGCIRDTVAALHAAGRTRAGYDVDELTTFAWSAVHGIALLRLDGVVDADPVPLAGLIRAAVLGDAPARRRTGSPSR